MGRAYKPFGSRACHHVEHRELGKTYIEDEPGRDAAKSEITKPLKGSVVIFHWQRGLQFWVTMCLIALNEATMTASNKTICSALHCPR